MLTFVEDGHLYFWNGAPVPSVSEILDTVLGDEFPKSNAGDVAPAVKHAGNRGDVVHREIAKWFRPPAGEVTDEETIAPEVRGYFNAAKLFCVEGKFSPAPEHVEERLYSAAFGFAGTIDVWIPSPRLIVDWKTSLAVSPRWRLRTAAYAILAGDAPVTARMCVQLRPDGQYKLNPHFEHSKDRREFLTILAAYRIKENLR